MSQPVAAAQLVLVTAAEGRTLVGGGNFAATLPLAATGKAVAAFMALLCTIFLCTALVCVYSKRSSEAPYVHSPFISKITHVSNSQ